MKTCLCLVFAVVLLVGAAGCTRIVNIEPAFGPPGIPVYVTCSGMFGDPGAQCLQWDGKTIRECFAGSFTVPAIDNGGTRGEHKVTLVDKLDGDELSLVFPIFRLRRDSVTFHVTEP